MPEVYIDSLTLENFGPYYGEHTFNFGVTGHFKTSQSGSNQNRPL